MNEQRKAMIGRELLERAAKLGLVAMIALSVVGDLSAGSAAAETTSSSDNSNTAPKANSIKPPAQGSIAVAFLVSEGAVIIDFCGPWEVFQDVNTPGRQDHPFRLYTVAESTSPIHASGGMQIVPDYTLANAPAPNVIVIPAQSEPRRGNAGMDSQSDNKHRRNHVGLHRRVCSGEDRPLVRQSCNYISQGV